MEIELRAAVKDVALLEKKLLQLADIREKGSEKRQVDLYFKHEADAEQKMVIRIRKNYENDHALLTFKGKSVVKDEDIAWPDFDVHITDPDRLEKLLVNNGYVYVCLIDKMRQSFIYKEFEINVDHVRDLGVFVEVEKNGSVDEIEMIKKEIALLLQEMGVVSEDIIKEGYVTLMMRAALHNGACCWRSRC